MQLMACATGSGASGSKPAAGDAASNLKNAVGAGDSAEWDKIVIMGQQIAGDDELFAGAGVAGATKAVDLAFDGGMDDAGELDMDFGGEATGEPEVFDLGAAEEKKDDTGLDFAFDDDEADADGLESTAEMPMPDASAVETAAGDEQFADGTAELPSLDDDDVRSAIAASGQETDATAEINLDELEKGSEEAPVIRLCNQILAEAVRLFDPADYVEGDLRLPLYDEDLEKGEGIPEEVQRLAGQIMSPLWPAAFLMHAYGSNNCQIDFLLADNHFIFREIVRHNFFNKWPGRGPIFVSNMRERQINFRS